jgi:hypothetical protein
MAKDQNYKWREFDPSNKHLTPQEGRLCYISSETMDPNDGFIGSYQEGEWYEYGSQYPLSEPHTNRLHWCHLPLPPNNE